jgi:hypothetical protein
LITIGKNSIAERANEIVRFVERRSNCGPSH